MEFQAVRDFRIYLDTIGQYQHFSGEWRPNLTAIAIKYCSNFYRCRDLAAIAADCIALMQLMQFILGMVHTFDDW